MSPKSMVSRLAFALFLIVTAFAAMSLHTPQVRDGAVEQTLVN